MAAPERKPFLLRIPPGLWQDLEKWAADDLRSVNGQIEFILRQAVARRKSQAAREPDEPESPG
jgi:hypothetical protein